MVAQTPQPIQDHQRVIVSSRLRVLVWPFGPVAEADMLLLPCSVTLTRFRVAVFPEAVVAVADLEQVATPATRVQSRPLCTEPPLLPVTVTFCARTGCEKARAVAVMRMRNVFM
jgi:hypothetical protein